MTQASKNVYIDKLDDIVNEYSNIFHGTMKMKYVYVTLNTCIDFNKENNKEDPNFEANVKISKYKTMLQKFELQIGLKTFL